VTVNRFASDAKVETLLRSKADVLELGNHINFLNAPTKR